MSFGAPALSFGSCWKLTFAELIVPYSPRPIWVELIVFPGLHIRSHRHFAIAVAVNLHGEQFRCRDVFAGGHPTVFF